jgi:hypothetical protein
MTDRVPYAERERVIDQWCSCEWVWTGEDYQPKRRHMHSRDPHCPLHGDYAKPAPF